jgi:hypothetical protein
MLNKTILIKQLEDFKDTKKYSRGDLADFLSKTVIIKDYYNECVKDILTYIKNNGSSSI